MHTALLVAQAVLWKLQVLLLIKADYAAACVFLLSKVRSNDPSLAVGHSRLVWRDGWKHRGSPSDTHTVHCERVGRVAQFRLKKASLKVRIVSEAGNRLDSRLRVQKVRPRILWGMAGRNCAQMYGKRGWKWGGIEGILWFAAGP